ncbi:MAG: segregation/condensation protein A [Bdellovibrionales bacterium]|nr:segregation/condensation protein A [Bdellovibrionales bacterium]
MSALHIQLDRFEGPLGLLLHLIRKEEMDIFDINIHQITHQYLEYIKAMRHLDLETAGDFVAMAATLIHIKSRMLLPSYNEEGEEIETEDPRKVLVQKLLEYQKYQEAAHKLYDRPLLNRDWWLRGRREDLESVELEGELIVEDNPLFSLISSYREAVKKMKKTVHRVLGELQSIASRILEIKDRLVVGQRVLLNDLVTDIEKGRDQLLVTFLSLLELAKMGFVRLFQAQNYGDLYIEARRSIEEASVSQVENYESAYRDEEPPLLEQLSFVEDEMEESLVPPQASWTPEQIAESFAAEGLAPDEETVAEDGLVEAASDEEILAEEARLFQSSPKNQEGNEGERQS